MTYTNKIYTITIIFLLSLCSGNYGFGQDVKNTFQPRMEVMFNYKPIKKLELSFTPEIRLTKNFCPDKYLFGFGAEYKLTKWLRPEAQYQFVINKREHKPTENHRQYALGLTGDANFYDFSGSLRIRYTNDSDDDSFGNQFLRYKAVFKYDIPNFKLTPFIAAEAFHKLGGENKLYKLRYEAGGNYELKKNHHVKVAYKFDYYKFEYKNRHILSISYKIDF
jgi:hypothetical protein